LHTVPAVAVALFVRRVHRVGRLAGWAPGMGAGTTMLAMNGSVSVIAIGNTQIYAALLAPGINLAVASALMPQLDRLGMPRGLDRTGTEGLAAGTLPSEEWLRARPS
jgi:SSS family solute:Na+ symporter